jgi:apolipoprotein N-acyltransferase
LKLKLAPWGPRLAALAAGVAAGLAHPPFGVLPGLLGYAVLLHLLDAPNRRSAFLRGWLAGVGYFAVGVWWVVEPFMVDAAEQGWMAPFALVLMAGGLALFWGLGALVYRTLNPGGMGKVLVFAGCLAGAEWLRGHVLTGFPWDLPGESWAAGSAPSQAAAFVGAYGLSWITLALAAAPAVLADKASVRTKSIALAIALVSLALLCSLGQSRLNTAPLTPSNAPLIRIVQANIDQKVKWKPENLESIFRTYVALSHTPAADQPDLVIWPEGALPVVIDDFIAPGSDYAARLRDAVAPGQSLLMGVNRAQTGKDGTTAYFNSLMAFHREANVLRVSAVYDKHRLVPFGEFMPAGDLAGRIGLRSLVHMPDDFTAGPAPRPIVTPGAPPMQPLICYEALFPGLTGHEGHGQSGGQTRPAWILNISNDAWFGQGSGPWQHLNISSYRAIEQGLPMVRATPTGVSGVIDAYGRLAPGKSLGLGAEGVIDARLPPALAPTLYSRWGDALFGLMLAASALPLLRRRR